jgi:hypothetical protein
VVSGVQRFLRAVLPARLADDMEAESRAWIVRCEDCGEQRSVWELGGVRWKAKGTPRVLRRCPTCRDRTWHTVSRRPDAGAGGQTETPPVLSDDAVEAQLRAAPEAAWRALAEAFARMDAEAEHVTWRGGDHVDTAVVDGVERPVFRMPYAEYTEAVEQVRSCLGSVGAFVVFPWSDWDGLDRLRGPSALDDAPVADAVRMLTAIVRSERFSDGSIAGAIEEGTFGAAVRRLLRWHAAHT